jgi:glycosyltransferase involved in cell wall biosynthesis
MRVGIYIKIGALKQGGGYTFGASLLEVLKEISTHHEMFILVTLGGLVKCYPFQEYFSPKKSSKHLHKEFITKGFYKLRNLLLKLVRKAFFLKVFLPYRMKRCILYPVDFAVKKNNIDLLWLLTPSIEFVRVPYIVPVWDLEPRLQPYFPEFFNDAETEKEWSESLNQSRVLFSRALYIITGTEFLKKKLEFLYNIPEERIQVIPFPLPAFVEKAGSLGTISEAVKVITEKPYLFYPAQFWAHKNHVTLLLALKILQEKLFLDFNLILTGSDQGNLSFIKQTVYDLGLQTKVHFPGFVSQVEILYLYQNAFALVFPTFFGPDNLPPLEAFALGCPVIASKLPGVDEQLEDAAILVDPCSESGFAEAVSMLSLDPELRNSLIAKGKIRAAKWTSADYVREVFRLVDTFATIKRNW